MSARADRERRARAREQRARTTGAVCGQCLDPLVARPVVVCRTCLRRYHRDCIVEHRKLHRYDARKNWNFRRFWK